MMEFVVDSYGRTIPWSSAQMGAAPPGPFPRPPAGALPPPTPTPGPFVGPRPMFEAPAGVRSLGPTVLPEAATTGATNAARTGLIEAAPAVGARTALGAMSGPLGWLSIGIPAMRYGQHKAGISDEDLSRGGAAARLSNYGYDVDPQEFNIAKPKSPSAFPEYLARPGVAGVAPPYPTSDQAGKLAQIANDPMSMIKMPAPKPAAKTNPMPRPVDGAGGGALPPQGAPAAPAAGQPGALGDFDASIAAALGATPDQMAKAIKALEDANVDVDSAFADFASKSGVPPEVSRGLDRHEKGMLLLQFGLGTMGAASRPGANTFGALAQGGQGALAGYEGIINKREGRAKEVAQDELRRAGDRFGYAKDKRANARADLTQQYTNANNMYERAIDRRKTDIDAYKASTDAWYKKGQLDNGRRLADAAMTRAQKSGGALDGTFDFGDYYQQAIEATTDPAEAERIAIDASLQVGVPLPTGYGYQIGENGNLQVKMPRGGVHDTGRKPPTQ